MPAQPLTLRSIAQRCVSIARGNPRAVVGNRPEAHASRRPLRGLLSMRSLSHSALTALNSRSYLQPTRRQQTAHGRGRKLVIFLQLTLNGLAVGCIYGLVALGFVLIYKAAELVNFAQGDLLMLGAFVAYMAVVWWGLDYWLAFLIAVVVIGAFGALLDAVVLRQVIG